MYPNLLIIPNLCQGHPFSTNLPERTLESAISKFWKMQTLNPDSQGPSCIQEDGAWINNNSFRPKIFLPDMGLTSIG